VILKGSEKTSYQRKHWMLYVEFGSHYPSCPPNIRFATPIYHVNISRDGRICHPILGQSWCQPTKMTVVFENIFYLLKEPNPDDAVFLEKAHLYNGNQDEYKRLAEAHSNKHAPSDV
jgi:ubiquitin-protein ligase